MYRVGVKTEGFKKNIRDRLSPCNPLSSQTFNSSTTDFDEYGGGFFPARKFLAMKNYPPKSNDDYRGIYFELAASPANDREFPRACRNVGGLSDEKGAE